MAAGGAPGQRGWQPTSKREEGKRMCGIAGLFAKTKDAETALGRRLAGMLAQLSERGPDSAGIAVYRDGVAPGAFKATLYHPDERFDWAPLQAALQRRFVEVSEPARRGTN